MAAIAYQDLHKLRTGMVFALPSQPHQLFIVESVTDAPDNRRRIYMRTAELVKEPGAFQDGFQTMKRIREEGAVLVDGNTLREAVGNHSQVICLEVGDEKTEKKALVDAIDAPEEKKKKPVHIDEWLDLHAISDVMGSRGFENADYVHFMLDYFRRPAWMKMAHSKFMDRHALFVDYEGGTYRVTGASRLGDIFLAKNLSRGNGCGYDLRVNFDLTKLTNWRDTP